MLETIHEIELFALSGGKGTRLAPVWVGKPKILVSVDGRPYFDWFVDAMRSAGFSRFRFLLGMGADEVIEHVSNREDRDSIKYVVEESPLGTGGAVKNALMATSEERFFVVNGDSYCRIDYASMLEWHLKVSADCTMGVSYEEDSSDYGRVTLGAGMNIEGFQEKEKGAGAGYVNSGVYLLERHCTRFFPERDSFSLERDVFPKIVDSRGLYGFKSEGPLLDIGTPERLRLAQSELARLVAGE